LNTAADMDGMDLVDEDFIAILCCPETRQPLRRADAETLVTDDGQISYRIRDGIVDFTTKLGDAKKPAPKDVVKDYYEEAGWNADDAGVYDDTKRFMALGPVSRDYTRRCNEQVKTQLPPKGKYIVDAGSGAIPHVEYMAYHDNFDIRVCTDFSFAALQEAKRKLGAKGRYVMADLRCLPFKDASVDGVVCCHVVYHVPEQEQATAIMELSRILSPRGKAAIVYQWGKADLLWQMTKLFRVIDRVSPPKPEPKAVEQPARPAEESLYFYAHTYDWFVSRDWPFKYEIRSFRILDNPMMKRYLRDTPIWRMVVRLLVAWQAIMPNFTGKHGAYPLLILYPTIR